MSEDVLRAEGVGYSYSDGRTALSGVSIGCEEGSKVAFVGPNGAGKSTLLLMFNAILRPKVGAVLYRGSPLRYDTASLREIRRKVGVVLQNPDDQLFAPTVYLDVAFGPTNLDLPSDKVARYVDYALSYVGLEGYEDRTPHHLSGGEKKRVAIAGILAMEPEVMILDEPTSNLDPASSEEIMEMLDELNVYGKTVIISTHDVELAYRWADHVVLMNGGAVLREGPPESVFSDGPSIKKARLKRPMLLDLREELVGRGIMDEENELPKSILDMVDMIHRTFINRIEKY
jgi:cobalt/nickel transport system ATP-binding protein